MILTSPALLLPVGCLASGAATVVHLVLQCHTVQKLALTESGTLDSAAVAPLPV